MKLIKTHLLPLILIISGILDQTTDLLVLLLEQLGAPLYIGTLLRILIVIIGAIKLYYAQPPGPLQNTNN